VFADGNGNGVKDRGEAGLAGVTVFLDANGNGTLDPGEKSTQTDGSGNYLFAGLPAGTYTVAEVVPAGFKQTLPASPGTYPVTLTDSGAPATGLDFGNLPPLPDLAVQSISLPAAGSAGHAVTLSWTVVNQGSAAASGDWQDALYLSAGPNADTTGQPLALVPHFGTLAAGATYTGMVTVDLPALPLGNYYLTVLTDRRNQVAEGNNKANNVRVSATPLNLTIPQLTPGAPAPDTFTTPGESRFYQVTVPDGQTLVLSLAGSSGANELYVSYGTLPGIDQSDASSTLTGQASQEIVVPSTQAGTYFVLVREGPGSGTGGRYTLTASLPGFAIRGIAPASGGNSGPVTIAVQGSNLSSGTQVSLVSGATVIPALATYFRDPGQMYATFDLTGKAAGAYDVRLTDQGRTATAARAFTVTTGAPGNLQVQLEGLDVIRSGTRGVVTVDYRNVGNTDIAAPLLVLSADNANLFPPGETDPSSATPNVFLVGVNNSVPAGILPPGFEGKVSVSFLPITTGANAPINFTLNVLSDPGAAFPWDLLSSAGPPMDLDAAIWSATVTQAHTQMGDTWKSVLAAITGGRISQAPVPDIAYDFGTNLLNSVFVDTTPAGTSPLAGKASRDRSPPPPFYSEPVRGPSGELFFVRLYPVGNIVPNPDRVFLVTHGWHGTQAGDRFQNLATDIKDIYGNNDNINVYRLDWSVGSEHLFPWDAARNIDVTAQAGADLLRQAQVNPATLTTIGESFGDYVNDGIARDLGGVDLELAFNPANERGMWNWQPVPSLVGGANLTVAFHTWSFADTPTHIANFDLYLETPPGSGQGQQHTFGVQWLDNCIQMGDRNWLNPITIGLQHAPDPRDWDGTARLDCSYDPTPPPRCRFDFLRNWFSHLTLRPIARKRVDQVNSIDPNDIQGPAGFGSSHWVAADQPLAYTVHFENAAGATAPAQSVVVTLPLDPNLDPSTFTLGNLGFGSTQVSVPAGSQSFQTSVSTTNPDGSPLRVDVTAGLNGTTGVATWTLQAIDPTTGQPPANPLDGFLPPDNAAHAGEGFLTYSAKPRAGRTSGTTVNGRASIVFDANTAMPTNTAANTLDSGAPTSSVTALPASEAAPNFAVAWSGADDAGGSGVATYDVYASVDGGPFTPWLTGTTQTSATFSGARGHTYGFYSVATDNVGHRQATPTAAQATTSVAGVLSVTLNPLLETAGTPFSGAVASFTSLDPAARAIDFTASITWGDGQFATGTVSAGSGGFAVTAGHVYAAEGRYPVAVTVTDAAGDRASATGLAHVARLGPPPSALLTVANFLTHSFEYYANFVTAAYQRYLGRSPAPSEVAGWVGVMQSGLSDEHLEAGFIGSPEYINNHGGPGAGWVTGMYVDLLGRQPTPTEVANWVRVLQNGMPAAAVAYVFAAGPEREAERITADYQKYLNRTPEAGIVAAWVNAFESGMNNESVIAGFVGGQEYFQKHYDNITDWLFSAYDDILGRDPDPAALAGWLPILANS
jgi:hypothetical protein